MDKLCKQEIRETLLEVGLPSRLVAATLDLIVDCVARDRVRRRVRTIKRRKIEVALRQRSWGGSMAPGT